MKRLRARRRRRRAEPSSARDRFVGLEPLEPRLLLSTFSLFTSMPGGGSSWADFNSDGFVDVMSGGWLWQNNSGASFTKHTAHPFGGNGTWGDFNNDGFIDYYGMSNHQLWRNDGGTGSFTQITMPAAPSSDHWGGT